MTCYLICARRIKFVTMIPFGVRSSQCSRLFVTIERFCIFLVDMIQWEEKFASMSNFLSQKLALDLSKQGRHLY